MSRKMKPDKIVLILLLLIQFAACSSKPKNLGDTYELRKRSEAQLDLGNKEADRGDFEGALLVINEAQRLAKMIDNPSLRIRCALSRGSVLFSLGNSQEASRELEAALGEAQREGNGELTAVSRIYIARYRLLSGLSPAQAVRDEVSREMGAIKSNDLYIALGWMVTGIAEKELGRYGEAEAALKRSFDIHEKNRLLEQAAYDWFLIGSFRSAAGNLEGAKDALNQAIILDRRVENSYGLAEDWRALGDNNKKMGKAEESMAAYLRSVEIFRSMGNDSAAVEVENRIQ
jgi:tetratricopeptide (TPR) repeat protein